MGYGKRKADDQTNEDHYKYSKRFRRSDSSLTPKLEKIKRSKDSDHHRGDGGYYSSRLSQPALWSTRKHRNNCGCQRHSDSGFETKSVKSPKHKRKSHCRRKVKEDEEGHLLYQAGDVLLNRYKLLRTIGQGTFGKVVAGYDMNNNDKRVAIKIVRKDGADYDDAVLEAKIIQQLQSIESGPDNLCIRVHEWFDYHGHLCIVFDMLGHSVYEFMRRNNFQPFSLEDVQDIGRQLCKAVKFCHDQKLAHTDLKPENVLFVDSRFKFEGGDNSYKRGSYRQIVDCNMRLIDFGSAVFENDHGPGIVSTRHYRAPEVVLDLGWTFPCDVWSIGCILFELYHGSTLFQTHDTLEHLAMMERVLGKIPSSMTPSNSKYFKRGRLDWDENTKDGRKVRNKCRPLKAYMRGRSQKHVQLFDLVGKMLEYKPEKRITMKEALSHPFFEV